MSVLPVSPGEEVFLPMIEESSPNFGFTVVEDPGADLRSPWSRAPIRLKRGSLELVPLGCTILRQAISTLVQPDLYGLFRREAPKQTHTNQVIIPGPFSWISTITGQWSLSSSHWCGSPTSTVGPGGVSSARGCRQNRCASGGRFCTGPWKYGPAFSPWPWCQNNTGGRRSPAHRSCSVGGDGGVGFPAGFRGW